MKNNKLRSPVYLIFLVLAMAVGFAGLSLILKDAIVDFVNGWPTDSATWDDTLELFMPLCISATIALMALVLLFFALVGAFAKSGAVILSTSLCLALLSSTVSVYSIGKAIGFDFLDFQAIADAFSSGDFSLMQPILFFTMAILLGFVAFIALIICYNRPRGAASIAFGIICFVLGLATTAVGIPYLDIIDDPSAFIELSVLLAMLPYLMPGLLGIALLGLGCYKPKEVEQEGEAPLEVEIKVA